MAEALFDSVVDVHECRYGPMLAFAEDQVITRSLKMYGEWAEHEIHVLAQYIRDGTMVLDVGSNIGTHALAFARRCEKSVVWGFEPRPVVSSLAEVNCIRNNARNVCIVQAACGAKFSMVTLAGPSQNEDNAGAFKLDGVTSLHFWARLAGWLGKAVEVQPPFSRVPIIPLDSLRFPSAVSLLKVDVEGMESQVIYGARKMISRDLPAVYFEVLDINLATEPFNLLRRLGYRCFCMETHQFNRNNFRKSSNNIWYRTELGVLALPHSISAPDGLRCVDDLSQIQCLEDARLGFDVPSCEPLINFQ
ncbi:FkbM family methyltransferase [Methylobacterium sp. E-016]|uniref:FkbM family methyltransferase n=1 Tax=Methylobacterium sp. E-016 TaxID=2836556 RepID=UPI001FB8CBE1|nr:FkbM family methyltransferase [Methylobacterium sp. E-016]MCJ2078921.1 FkbM family methyltransferase [Methylobacterium sp. E-016]